jgi:hypothetical protein
MVNVLFHPDWDFLIDSNEPSCQSFNGNDQGYILRNCGAIGGNISPFKDFLVPFEDENSALCGSIASTNEEGRYLTFDCVYPYNGTGLLSILPEIDHAAPLEGVTTDDLTRISKHILGITPLDNSFAILAADANNSGSITTFDIVELRKLILGIYLELPNNSNWRFIPDYCFNDPVFTATFNGPYPFLAKWVNPDESTPIPPNTNERVYGSGILPVAPNNTSWMDHVSIDPEGSGGQNINTWSFWGIKIGDVNCSADLDGLTTNDPDDKFVTVPHTTIITNQVFKLEVKAVGNAPVSSWQMGIEFAEDSLEILQIQPGNSGETFSLDNFGLTEVASGKLKALNFSETGSGINLNGKTLFTIVLKALKPISSIGQQFKLKNTVLPKKIYSTNGDEIESLDLQLNILQGSIMVGGSEYKLGMKNNSSSFSYNLTEYPVPFGSEITFEFELPKEEQIQLSIYDTFGRILLGRNEKFTKGYQSIMLDQLESIPAGLYWYSLEIGDDILFGKIIKK